MQLRQFGVCSALYVVAVFAPGASAALVPYCVGAAGTLLLMEGCWRSTSGFSLHFPGFEEEGETKGKDVGMARTNLPCSPSYLPT